MKRTSLLIATTLLLGVLASSIVYLRAADGKTEQVRKFEYATIRWSGRENTHIIRPNGEVEFLASQLDKLKKPNRTDDRSFYLNIVMNALSKEGYEFAGITNDDIVMKRSVGH